MALDQATTREDPREKLRALRAEFAKKAELKGEMKGESKAELKVEP
jgi:ATP-dependent DNA helicase Rep